MNALTKLQKLILATSILASSAMATEPSPERFFGEYRVESVTRYRGGLTSEVEARGFVGNVVRIGSDKLALPGVSLDRPVYKMRTIPIGKEGNIIPSDTSIFYGYYTDRTEILRLEAFKRVGGVVEDDPYDALEVLGDDTLLEMYDGWLIVLKKKT